VLLDRNPGADGEEVLPLPAAEVVQVLHRSLIRGADLDPAAELPRLVALGRQVRGVTLRAPTVGAARDAALRLLQILVP
jgi:hypothetical protein